MPRKWFTLVKIDGGIINDNDQKCDFILFDCEKKNRAGYFIELKGSDINQALSQIDSTFEKLKQTILDHGIEELHARIVVTKMPSPDIYGQAALRLMKKLKKYDGSVAYKSHPFEEKIWQSSAANAHLIHWKPTDYSEQKRQALGSVDTKPKNRNLRSVFDAPDG